MRKIKPSQIVVFVALLGMAILSAWSITRFTADLLPLATYRPFYMIGGTLLLVYGVAIAQYRVLLWLSPLPEGEIAEDSRAEFTYHVYLLFFLILFYPVIRSGWAPVPLMRLFYQALGARLGENTYSSGLLLDPVFVRLGRNCIVGQYALVVPHVIEGRRLAHYPITVGDEVTIGAGATILAGVTIGDRSIVSTGAVVTKGTQIGADEVWGGVPARRLKPATAQTPAAQRAPEAVVG